MLGLVRRVDAAAVDPEVLQIIAPCLCTAKMDLLVARLVQTIAIDNVRKCHLLVLFSPGVRQGRIRRHLFSVEALDAKLAIFVVREKAHRFVWTGDRQTCHAAREAEVVNLVRGKPEVDRLCI